MVLSIRQQLKQASEIIASGGICAYPTESCFGLGCNPKDSKAVQRILMLKRRSSSKGLILIGNNFSQLELYAKELPQYLKEKLLNSWPGAITWLVPAANWVPKWLTGDSDKIAIRIPDHKIARELCRVSEQALVSTSANQTGQKACRNSQQVKRLFDNNIDYIIDTNSGKSLSPSMIIDVETDNVIRSA